MGSGIGALAKATGASSARVTSRAPASADTREHSTGFSLDIGAAVEEPMIAGEGADSAQTGAQCWLEVASICQTEEAAGFGEKAADGPKRSSNIHSSVATNRAAAGNPKASTFKNGIEDLAGSAAPVRF